MGIPEDDREGRGPRSSGLLRVPFVRRCTLEFEDGRSQAGVVVNINVLGAYVARDGLGTRGTGRPPDLPRLGETVYCRFLVPGRQDEIRLQGVVSWLNVHQQHPVHSLPPGFGLRFEGLTAPDRAHIEEVVAEYLERQGTR